MKRRLPNWITAYLAYTNESESPEEFHKWVALSVIAGAIRRKAFYDMGYFLVYPNLYVILVSPPGRCKKSTAMRIGRGLMNDVPGLNFTTDSTSRERLIQDLSQSLLDGHSSMTAFSSEFASLLTTSGMDMIVFLTDIYDCPSPDWAHKTKSGGTNRIVSPYLNLIGGTTPKWIASAMPLDTVGIGLTSRIIFIYHDTPRVRAPRPELTAEQKALKELLVEDLIAISQIAGEYEFENKATEKRYDDWYQEQLTLPAKSTDDRLGGYWERKPIHMLKVCMILAAAQRDELVMTNADLDNAFRLLEEAESKMARVFANVGKNPLNIDIEHALELVHEHPGITFGELLGYMKHSVRKDELSEVMDTLAAMGIITVEMGTTPSNRKYEINAERMRQGEP